MEPFGNIENDVHVSSKSLEELQGNLNKLSENLEDCFDILNADTSALSERWRDQMFEDFEEEFKKRREMIKEFAERYHEWAAIRLPPVIEKVKEIENRQVKI